MKHTKKIACLLICLLIPLTYVGVIYLSTAPELTIIGGVNVRDGMDSQGPTLVEMLNDDISIGYHRLGHLGHLDNLSSKTKAIVTKRKNKFGRVILLESPLFSFEKKELIDFHANKSLGQYIKFDEYDPISFKNQSTKWECYLQSMFRNSYSKDERIMLAYSMYESTKIPMEWAAVINTYFDAVIIPDENLRTSYLNSGVTKPIITAPLPVPDLETFLKFPLKKSKNDLFIFLCLGSYNNRKNQKGIVLGFLKHFKNNPKVLLRLHGRYILGDNYYEELQNIIKNEKATNIIMSLGALPKDQYVEMLYNSDCLVNISKGEGFSIQPREAMAMGIPVILSDVLAQSTICKHPLVQSVQAKYMEPFFRFWRPVEEQSILDGYQYAFDENDIADAMLHLYDNYELFLKHSESAREWSKQYLPKNLKSIYKNLVSPKSIHLGDVNEVNEEGLTTTSLDLYKKYKLAM